MSRLQRLHRFRARSQHRSRCRPTRSSAREHLHRQHTARTLTPICSSQTRLLTAHPNSHLRLCSTLACGNEKCGRIPTSSASQSWRWLCASAANWTTSARAGHVGPSRQGKPSSSPTASTQTVCRRDGSRSRPEPTLRLFMMQCGNLESAY